MIEVKLNVYSLKTKCSFCRMKSWEDEVNSISSHQQLDILPLMENLTAIIQLEKKNPQTSSPTVPPMPLKLPLSFTTSKYAPQFNGMF